MDKTITTPGSNFVRGYVPQIRKKSEEHTFQISTHELELLVRHWSEEIKNVLDSWVYFHDFSASESRLEAYAWYRIEQIRVVLGKDQTDQIVEETNAEYFLTRYFESPEAQTDPPSCDAQVHYVAARYIIFNGSLAGLRPMPGVARVPGDGWCWQAATDFKAAKPVEHVGFPTADATCRAAGRAAKAFYDEVERTLEAFYDGVDRKLGAISCDPSNDGADPAGKGEV